MMTYYFMKIAAYAVVFSLLATSRHHLLAQGTPNESNPDDYEQMGIRMANHYTEQLDILVNLIEQPIPKSGPQKVFDKGKLAFETADGIFNDETLPHAHTLFAKLCVKLGMYEKSIELFDETLRRLSISLENEGMMSQEEIWETANLMQQLKMERTRSQFLGLQSYVHAWDGKNMKNHGGGIAPDTSPSVPLKVVEEQLKLFPKPNPQSLFELATFSVLLLDSPSDEEDDAAEVTDEKSKSWEAYETYLRAQEGSYDAYVKGRKLGLAASRMCKENNGGNSILSGGSAWKSKAKESVTYVAENGAINNDSDNFMGSVTLENVILSGKDAVPFEEGSDCSVYVPHRYLNLANNIPMLTSWETTDDYSSMASPYVPDQDPSAYGGHIGKDAMGNDALMIPKPKIRFDSAVLLTGYASDNYYHFVGEVLPSLVVLRNRVNTILNAGKDGKGSAKDVIIVPNLQNEFARGFFQLLLPDAFVMDEISSGEYATSPKIVQWGPGNKPVPGSNNEYSVLASFHPISHVHRLYAAAWDQPAQAPLGGPAHCLTPAPLLRAVRKAVWEAASDFGGSSDRDEGDSSKLKIVYCSRSSSSTRVLKEEKELISRLESVASKMDAEFVMFEKKADENESDYSSSPNSALNFILDTVELFQSATVVVGVHGASLANIAFSRPGTTVVEMGFEGLPQASHYRHLSQSLGLNHVDVFLKKDARSLGATEVELRKGGDVKVLEAVVDGLASGLKRMVHTEL